MALLTSQAPKYPLTKDSVDLSTKQEPNKEDQNITTTNIEGKYSPI